jgi:hypothetical protein
MKRMDESSRRKRKNLLPMVLLAVTGQTDVTTMARIKMQ